MPSKIKSKKSQKKSSRSMSTVCWEQNDDGTLSLSIGPKKTADSSTDNSNDPDLIVSPISEDHNGNAVEAKIEIKTPPVFIPPTLPIQILKASWSENGDDYRMRQQTLRRKEMTKKYGSRLFGNLFYDFCA